MEAEVGVGACFHVWLRAAAGLAVAEAEAEAEMESLSHQEK